MASIYFLIGLHVMFALSEGGSGDFFLADVGLPALASFGTMALCSVVFAAVPDTLLGNLFALAASLAISFAASGGVVGGRQRSGPPTSCRRALGRRPLQRPQRHRARGLEHVGISRPARKSGAIGQRLGWPEGAAFGKQVAHSLCRRFTDAERQRGRARQLSRPHVVDEYLALMLGPSDMDRPRKSIA